MSKPKRVKARGAGPTLPPGRVRRSVANITHDVLTEAFGNDPEVGSGRLCLFYATLGSGLASWLTNRDYYVVVGSSNVVTTRAEDTPDGLPCSVEIRAGALEGEFHAWFQGWDRSTQAVTEVVDLTSRHYRRNYEYGLKTGRGVVPGSEFQSFCRWTMPDPPGFIWATPETFPSETVQLQGDRDLTAVMREQFWIEHRGAMEQLIRVAVARLRGAHVSAPNLALSKRLPGLSPEWRSSDGVIWTRLEEDAA